MAVFDDNEKKLVAGIVALGQELASMAEAGEAAVAEEPAAPAVPEMEEGYTASIKKMDPKDDMAGTTPEEEPVEKEVPDEVANAPAEKRVEDDDADQKVAAAVQKALEAAGLVKKSKPADPSMVAMGEMVKVMKSMKDQIVSQGAFIGDLSAAIGIDNQIQKSIEAKQPKPVMVSGAENAAMVELIRKSLATGIDRSVEAAAPTDVRKELGTAVEDIFRGA